MRRLPVYFLIDVSESMVGEPIEQVQEGIASIVTELKTDPYALETVWVSIIGFAGKSNVITPLQDIITFYPPKIPVGSGAIGNQLCFYLQMVFRLMMLKMKSINGMPITEKKQIWSLSLLVITQTTIC